MKKSIIGGILVALILVGAGAGVLYYMNDQMKYLTTEEAKVQGDLSTVSATVNGSVVKWNVQEGQKVKKDDVIAVIQPAGVGSSSNVEVTAPADGTVIQSKGAVGQFVSVGTPLVMITPLDQLYVTANIEEGDLQDVEKGADAEITLDAFPGVKFKGKVEQIGYATTSIFSMIPATNSSGNYTKVVQKVPVKISLEHGQEDKLVPGLNAVVKISK